MRKLLLGKVKNLLTKTPTSKIEIAQVLKQAAKRGILDNNTLYMLEGVLDIQEARVVDAMVPRPEMITLESDMDLDTILPLVVESGHSRFPVFGENKDEVLGIILAKDLLHYLVKGANEPFNIQDIMRPAAVIPESKRVNVLLQDFRLNRTHIAMVVDEYGRITGLITIEDVLEQIVGEISDEYDIETNTAITQLKNGCYTVKALTTVDEFNEYFEATLEAENVETIGGLVARAFGHLPKRGETIMVDRFQFTVLRADNRRIHLLSVLPQIVAEKI